MPTYDHHLRRNCYRGAISAFLALASLGITTACVYPEGRNRRDEGRREMEPDRRSHGHEGHEGHDEHEGRDFHPE